MTLRLQLQYFLQGNTHDVLKVKSIWKFANLYTEALKVMLSTKRKDVFILLVCIVYGIVMLPLRFEQKVGSSSSYRKFTFELSDTNNATTNNSTPASPKDTMSYPPLNVLFCLSGNHTGFLAEFVVALKSVFLNAPIDTGMNIHVIGDQEARAALPGIFNETQVLTWKTRQPIQVHTYDITNLIRTIKIWKNTICQNHKKMLTYETHTIGTLFRWFAADVIDVDMLESKHVVYMDTDVITISNLGALLPQTQSEYQHISFQWSEKMCAGFMIINLESQIHDREILSNMTNFHDLMKDNHTFTKEQIATVSILNRPQQEFTDQSMYELLNATHPEKVSFLSHEWDITVTDVWKFAETLVQERPNGVGQMHFNGGGSSKTSWFENNSYLQKKVFNSSFGLANHYVNLPWTWAKYMVESKMTNGYPSFPVELIEHPVYVKPN